MLTVMAVAQGGLLAKIGYATPFWIIGGALGAISSGLFYTMDVDTSTGKWVGYQLICGFAVGGAFQVGIGVIQVNAEPKDMSPATAINFCECD